MPAVARKRELEPAPTPTPTPTLKTFHASVVVTRVEEWWVEAESAEQAQALLASGQGHHCAVGERVQIEVERMLEE
jgi:hypothetical protein